MTQKQILVFKECLDENDPFEDCEGPFDTWKEAVEDATEFVQMAMAELSGDSEEITAVCDWRTDGLERVAEVFKTMEDMKAGRAVYKARVVAVMPPD